MSVRGATLALPFASRERVSSAAAARVRLPWATLLLVALLAAIHVAQQRHVGFSVQFGVRSLAMAGLLWSEPGRLFSASFLHSSYEHLARNTGVLLAVGSLIEVALGRAVVLNVALWGGASAMLVGLLHLGGLRSAVGASGMAYALLGAYLTWRALEPGLFGPFARNPFLWVFLLLFALDGIARDGFEQTRFHLAGFAYGAGWGLLGLRVLPARWRRGCAALAVGLCLASGASVVLRVARQDPVEVTETMRVWLGGKRPHVAVNTVAWYWATHPAPPPGLLAQLEERMQAVVSEEPLHSYRDTLATLSHRLGKRDDAVATERAAIEGDAPSERLSFLVSQLARFEHARLAARDPAALAGSALRLRRVSPDAFELASAGGRVGALPRRALVLDDDRLAGYLELAPEENGARVRVPAPTQPPSAPVAGELRAVPLVAPADAPPRATRLWWMDPEAARLP